MPNYCENQIRFSVNKPEHRQILKDLEQEFKTKKEVLNVLRPMPEGCLEEGKWYDWCNCNWGTKWDMMEGYDITCDDNGLTICGDTAWSPPEAALLYYHQRHPEVTIDVLYFEPGGNFAGHTQFKNGEEKDVKIIQNIMSETRDKWETDSSDFGEWFYMNMEHIWEEQEEEEEEGVPDDPIIPESSDVGGLDKE
tara:strand:- start:622 stop:1203 length:582 start_codon:yes stop_codon:yes gene_type:complete